MKYLKYLYIFLIMLTIVSLAQVYINLEPNVFKWNKETRAMSMIITLMLLIVFVVGDILLKSIGKDDE